MQNIPTKFWGEAAEVVLKYEWQKEARYLPKKVFSKKELGIGWNEKTLCQKIGALIWRRCIQVYQQQIDDNSRTNNIPGNINERTLCSSKSLDPQDIAGKHLTRFL